VSGETPKEQYDAIMGERRKTADAQATGETRPGHPCADRFFLPFGAA
jgi:hypothetical protein